MKIEIQHIPNQGITLAYREEARTFSVLKEMVDNSECRFIDPVDITLEVTAERDLITVVGSIEAKVQLVCSRCLDDFQSDLQHKFKLRFSREIPADVHSGEEEVELTAEKIGLIYFQGEEIEFRDAVQEQVVLALPYKPLCREDCKGLCPRCGADLNSGQCNCTDDTTSNPFAVLKFRNWPTQKPENK